MSSGSETRMASQFRREYTRQLPLPLAQLYRQAYNAKDARARHNQYFYLFEALIKYLACPGIALYLEEVARGEKRSAKADHAIEHLALPSLGHWVQMLRELSGYFAKRPDSSAHPLGHVRDNLEKKRHDLEGALALYRRIKGGIDSAPSGDRSCSLMELIESLVMYRNIVFGHGSERSELFYRELGPLLFPALNEVLHDSVFSQLMPRGAQPVFIAGLHKVEADTYQVLLKELVGEHGTRMDPARISADQAEPLVPERVALLWQGRSFPLMIDPLLMYREGEYFDEVLFLNRDRNGRQVEYLSYTTGKTHRDKKMVSSLRRLLTTATGRDVTESELNRLADKSLSETSPDERVVPESAPLTRTVGEFEILTRIGRGGMGEVFLARQRSLGRLVALKMLSAGLAGDEVALARFRREIRILGRCEHPHIVKIISSDSTPDGQMFYAMEYVPGCDLDLLGREISDNMPPISVSQLSSNTFADAVLAASRQRREEAATSRRENESIATETESASKTSPESMGDRINATDAWNGTDWSLPELTKMAADDNPGGYVRHVAMIMRDAARAVQFLHDQNIIHRDIKPANLMLTPDGSRIVLMDFGLAKGLGGAYTQTESRDFLGTLRYAAPEQLAAAMRDVGPQADVRALGVTLWELLARRRLFEEARDPKQLATLIDERDVPQLRTIDPSVNKDLEAIVSRATARNTSDRIESAAKLADYLDLFLENKTLPIRNPTLVELGRRWVREHKSIAGLAASLLIAIVIGGISTTIMWQREAIQRRRADASFRDAWNSVREYFITVSEETLLNQPGMQPLQKSLLEKARDYYQKFLRDRSEDSRLQADIALAHFGVAVATEKIEGADAAMSDFEKALAIQDSFPGTPVNKNALAYTLTAMGNASSTLGRYDDANRFYSRSLDLRQQLFNRERNNIEYGRRLANIHMNIGMLEVLKRQDGKTHDLKAASKRLLQAQELRTELRKRGVASFRLLRDTGKGFYNLGLLSEFTGDGTAGRYFEQSVDAFEQLQDEYRADLEARRLLAQSHRKRVDAIMEDIKSPEELDEAIESYMDTLSLIEPLVGCNPQVVGYQFDEASVYLNLGNAYARRKDFEEAIDALENAVSRFQSLVKDNPRNRRFRIDYAVSLRQLATAQHFQNQFHQRDVNVQLARTLLTALGNEFPQDREIDSERKELQAAEALFSASVPQA